MTPSLPVLTLALLFLGCGNSVLAPPLVDGAVPREEEADAPVALDLDVPSTDRAPPVDRPVASDRAEREASSLDVPAVVEDRPPVLDAGALPDRSDAAERDDRPPAGADRLEFLDRGVPSSDAADRAEPPDAGPCGRRGEPCCWGGGVLCGEGLSCRGSTVTVCACGDPGEACCPGLVCNPVMGRTNTCRVVGARRLCG